MKTLTEADVREALATVMDPEIPVVSIIDLGLVERINLTDDAVEIDLLPTFSGCPALDVIREDAERAVADLTRDRRVSVRFVNDPPWTTERLTEAARAAMGGYGIAGPLLQIGRARNRCPYCASEDTREESAFGPTLCRTIQYCSACKNPFEGFKRKG